MKHFNGLLKLVCIGAGLLAVSVNGYSWGQKGHDVTCALAEKHLTKKAKKQITELLDGRSIVYWANWMDNASHTPEYKYTSTWHYKNIDADKTYENAPLNENGDVSGKRFSTHAGEGNVADVAQERLSDGTGGTVIRYRHKAPSQGTITGYCHG